MTQQDPIVVAIALSLYGYNVSPVARAKKLYGHFDGNCADINELIEILMKRGAYAATELAYPTAKVYVAHAIERYGDEALQRAQVNEDFRQQRP